MQPRVLENEESPPTEMFRPITALVSTVQIFAADDQGCQAAGMVADRLLLDFALESLGELST